MDQEHGKDSTATGQAQATLQPTLQQQVAPHPRRTGCSCWDEYRIWCDENDRDLYEMERWGR